MTCSVLWINRQNRPWYRSCLVEIVVSGLVCCGSQDVLLFLSPIQVSFLLVLLYVYLTYPLAQVLPLADQIILIDHDGGVQIRRPEDIDRRELDFSKFSGLGSTAYSTLQEEEKELEPDTSQAEAEVEARDLKRRTGDLAVYKYYLKSIGSRNLIVFVLFVVLNVFSSSFSRKYLPIFFCRRNTDIDIELWLKWWTDIDGRQIALYSSVYFALAICYSVGMGGYAW